MRSNAHEREAISDSSSLSQSVLQSTIRNDEGWKDDNGWIAVGNTRGQIKLLPWPYLEENSNSAPFLIQQRTENANESESRPSSFQDTTTAPATLSGGVACLSVSAGDTFVVALSRDGTTVFQYRYLDQSKNVVIDPHVQVFTHCYAIALSNTGLRSAVARGIPRSANQSCVWQGPNVAPLLRNRQDQLFPSNSFSGLYVGQPSWMKDLNIDGRDAELRLSAPDKGLQTENVFGCDSRGMGCCAAVARMDQDAGWLGDIVWYSGSFAVIYNARSGYSASMYGRIFSRSHCFFPFAYLDC